jgi:hypothetical protein
MLLLWPLWELLLTETPLILIGEDPSECSHAILTLLSLMTPLKPWLTVDYRPYTTLYEGDIKEYAARSKERGTLGNVLLGVTNPYIVQYIRGASQPAVLHMERQHFTEKKYPCPKDVELNVKSFNGKLPKELKYALTLPPKT